MTAKVNAMMRRSYAYRGSVEILRAGEVSLNLADAALHYQEQQLELTKNEFKIMKMLMENAGSLVSRDRLIARLWDDGDFIDDNTLTVNVTRIRKKLKSMGVEDFIQTKKGIGYKVKEC